MEKDRKGRTNGMLLLTKLLLLRHQVTLSQIPLPRRRRRGWKTPQVSRCVLALTPNRLLTLVGQTLSCIDLLDQFFGDQDNGLKGLHSILDERAELSAQLGF
jgi:hypothetical protein